MAEPDIFTKYPSLKKMQGLDDKDIVESHDGRELRGSPPDILAAMDEFASQEDFLINIGPDKADKLTDLICEPH
ncbi:unnamed protein product [Penicillium camemberti]|uniref:Str. FM013 n=1 Tax=Penicillium camemberti (strain FM 013) TaxID=1429867 RepID=A0A0G4PXD4_PENC3|nr:unnamed protein product [Penicillium camemberti]